MENVEKVDPNFYVDLLGKKRRVRFNVRALIAYVQLTGVSLMNKGVDIYNPESLVYFVYAALVQDSPELRGPIDSNRVPHEAAKDTIEALADMDTEQLMELSVEVIKAFLASKAVVGKEKKKGSPAAKSGTSLSSTPIAESI